MSDSGSIEETIFIGARQIALPEERAAYLDMACGGDRALRERVERMLHAEEKADLFLANDPLQVDKTALETPEAGEVMGSMIGRYKLLQQIGEGGCGIVYMAEQEQPIRRRVALKVIKPGMDTKQVIARFDAERQALAMMDHPNIARILDAGMTGDTVASEISNLKSQIHGGRLYFVMELVRGIRITDYCDQNNLSTRERLDLFMKVVQAVQHAHQKGIIHRDIKPSNVLVTLHDGVPVPKVIDFGIAKALEQKLTDKTLFTQFEQFIGTPAYTSPEQAEMSGLDIDTRSDIYSLGVLLYELLVGQTPFDAQELMRSGLAEMRRIIREQEPARPSTRLSTMLQGDVTTTAHHRRVSVPELVHLLKGDLDWIVMKCLEKDRTRRYETANGLGSDIERYLGNEPVTARPPSRVYRIGKLVRRNKLAFAAGTAVAMALVIGIVVSAWQAARARQAEQVAKEERDSAEAVLWFFRDKVMAAGRPEGQGGGLGKDVTLLQAIDAAEGEISKTFTNRPLVEASIRKTLGESYRYLGEPGLAIQQLERALTLRREGLGLLHKGYFSTLELLRDAYIDAGQAERILPLLEELLTLHRTKLGPDHHDTLRSMHALAYACNEAGKPDQGLALNEELFKLGKAKFGPDHPSTLSSLNNLGMSYLRQGRPEQALRHFEALHKLRKAKLGPEHPDTLLSLFNVGAAYRNQGKFNEAIVLYEQVLDLQKGERAEHSTTLQIKSELAEVCTEAKKFDQALPLFEELYKLRSAKLGPEHPDTLVSMYSLAVGYLLVNKLDQALPLFEKALRLQKAKLGPDHPETLVTMKELARAYGFTEKLDEAVALNEEALKVQKAKLGPDHPDTLVTMYDLAWVYQKREKLDHALALYEETLRLQKAKLGPDHPSTLETMYMLADAYWLAGKLDQAVQMEEQTLKLRKAKLGSNHQDTRNSMLYLADKYRELARFDQAEALLRESLKLKNDSLTTTLELARVLLEWTNADTSDPARRPARAEEGEQLARDYLAKSRLRYTNDVAKLEGSLSEAAELRYRLGQFPEAEPLYRELLQSRRARLDAGDGNVTSASASLGRLLADWAWAERPALGVPASAINALPLSTSPEISSSERAKAGTPNFAFARAREAEQLLRKCLAARLSGTDATHWRVEDMKSRLGGALVSVAVTDRELNAATRDAKLAEAETLLVEGNERLQASRSADKKYKRDALERLTRLYESWSKPGKRAEAQRKLEAFDKAKSRPATPEPESP